MSHNLQKAKTLESDYCSQIQKLIKIAGNLLLGIKIMKTWDDSYTTIEFDEKTEKAVIYDSASEDQHFEDIDDIKETIMTDMNMYSDHKPEYSSWYSGNSRELFELAKMAGLLEWIEMIDEDNNCETPYE